MDEVLAWPAAETFGLFSFMVLEGLYGDDAEEAAKIFQWPDAVEADEDKQAAREMRRSLAAIGVELDWSQMPGMQPPDEADPPN